MQNKKLSIKKFVSYLNNEEAEGGGFWLPNIQRPFVWSESQICKLFDSIMREYPISTLLVWKTKENIKKRKFIDLYYRNIKLSDYYIPENRKMKTMVLDGQQRLQSLFIGIKGNYEKKELFFDILSGGEDSAPEDIKYKFSFKKEADWPWIKLKEILYSKEKLPLNIANTLTSLAPKTNPLNDNEIRLLQTNVAQMHAQFIAEDNITYQELDSTEDENTYRIDDIVEIFIRANSGGTKLGKSDLLFSLLSSSWDDADENMEELLNTLNKDGFKFDRDFILKSCLVMLNKGARYEVDKFRDGKTKEEIVQNWDNLSNAIKAVKDFLVSKTYIRSDKALPSYQALIPLIYYYYFYKEKFSSDKTLPEYLLRVLLAGVFSGSPDALIDKIVRNINSNKEFLIKEIFGVVRLDGRNLDISSDMIFSQGYQSKYIHLLFNIWYKNFNYCPAFNGNIPSIDHVFPQSLLKTVKSKNPETGKMNCLRYHADVRDQLANCMLLTIKENGASGKKDTPPNKWFSSSNFKSPEEQQKYLDLHLIPKDSKLWELDNFEKFIEERKKLIKEKFSDMLIQDE